MSLSIPEHHSPLAFAHGALTVDIENRTRFELFNNSRDFDRSVNDDNDDAWLLNRFRLGLSMKPAGWLRAYVQAQDAREWDSDRPNIPGVHGSDNEGDFDLRQAYMEFTTQNHTMTLIVGRQSLNYGEARLVADGGWGNFGRTYDGVSLRLKRERVGWVDVFAVRPVQTKEGNINDSDSADTLLGVYVSAEWPSFQTTELYAFYRDKRDNQPDLSPTNEEDPVGTWTGPAQRITTIGTRMASRKDALGPWDYGLEAAFQFGEVWPGAREGAPLKHTAFALHSAAGYTWRERTWQPRLGLEYNYASGDRNPSDERSESFQNLFPSNHTPYGIVDEFSWRNMHDVGVQLTLHPAPRLTGELAWHCFWLSQSTDYWFRSSGNTVLRSKTPSGIDVRMIGADRFAGHEAYLTLKFRASENLTLSTGFGHFFPGIYLRETGSADGADFAYFQTELKF